MHKILAFLTRRMKPRTIFLQRIPYLRRYYLFGKFPEHRYPGVTGRWQWLPSVYLHEILLPDGERSLHNHPWTWSFAWVLSGGYEEIRLKDGVQERRHRRPLHFNFFWPSTFHRITKLRRLRAWTLFVASRRSSHWGFLDTL